MRAWMTLLAACAVLAVGCGKKPDDADVHDEAGLTGPPPQVQPTPPAPAPDEPAADEPAGADDLPALADGALEGKSWTIGYSQCNRGEPWRVQMDADVEAAAEKYECLELVMRDAQNDVAKQQAQVREFISQGVDLIIISPKEARPLTAPVAEAMDAGIPVVVLDRAVEGDQYTCFIGADNVKIGREAGKYLVETLGGKGKVVELMGLQTSTPGQDRHNGFVEGIAGSEIEVVFSADCEWLEDDAKREMASALQTNEQIDAVYGHNDPSAHGAYMATKQEGKGRETEIKFVGIDALPHEGVKYVEEGVLSATFLYPTGGDVGIEAALRILCGLEVPKKIVLGTKLFTADNVAAGGQDIP